MIQCQLKPLKMALMSLSLCVCTLEHIYNCTLLFRIVWAYKFKYYGILRLFSQSILSLFIASTFPFVYDKQRFL